MMKIFACHLTFKCDDYSLRKTEVQWPVYCQSQNVFNTLNRFELQTEADEALLNKKRSKKVQKKYEVRQRTAKVEPAIEEQFHTGRLLGK